MRSPWRAVCDDNPRGLVLDRYSVFHTTADCSNPLIDKRPRSHFTKGIEPRVAARLLTVVDRPRRLFESSISRYLRAWSNMRPAEQARACVHGDTKPDIPAYGLERTEYGTERDHRGESDDWADDAGHDNVKIALAMRRPADCEQSHNGAVLREAVERACAQHGDAVQ
jgi:hypothetical protein